jgi:hypothetical protein
MESSTSECIRGVTGNECRNCTHYLNDTRFKYGILVFPTDWMRSYLQLRAISLGKQLGHKTEIRANLTQYFIEIQCFYLREKRAV